jgi:hypothetical protein
LSARWSRSHAIADRGFRRVAFIRKVSTLSAPGTVHACT